MIKQVLEDYMPKNEQETVDKQTILEFIKNNDDYLDRTNKVAHMSSSAIVVNKSMDKVLFAHHNIYNSWGWVGGHNDGDNNPLRVAINEAKEETGVKNIIPYSEEIFIIDVIFVFNHIKHDKYVNDHLHLNTTYLLIADENDELVFKPDENSGVKWFDIDTVMEQVTEERIKSVYNKAFDIIKKLKEQIK
jgi:8-oxo-dGTP pyrophosphatase MutT (NUDIX family)